MIKICYICTGNTCRSIMAERLMKMQLKKMGIKDVSVSSKGLQATGENIAENAKKALKTLKALSSNRKSIKLKKIDKDTLYVVMNDDMKKFVAGRVISMKDLMRQDIDDPYGQNEEIYLSTAKTLMKANEKLITKINNWRKL